MANKYAWVKILSKNNPSFDFLPSEDIKVFHLEAPLSLTRPLQQYTGTLVQINLFHTSLGFECGNIKFQIEFTANVSLANAVLPELINNEVVWKNDCSIRLCDPTLAYWAKSNYFCTISKNQFIKFRDNILSYYIPNNLYYVIFSMSLNKQPYIRSSTCYDFVLYGINFFRNLGVPIEYLTYPNVIRANIDASQIVKLDYNTDKKEIYNFYTNYTNNFSALREELTIDFNKGDYNLIIPAIMKFYKSLGTIIYYAHDINKPDMTYYRVKLAYDTNVYNYERINIDNTVKYIPFKNMLTLKNNGNSNSKKNTLIYILIGLLIIFIIIILYRRYTYKKK